MVLSKTSKVELDLKNNRNEKNGEYLSTLYGLMRLYADPYFDLVRVLIPEASQPNPLDHMLSWFLNDTIQVFISPFKLLSLSLSVCVLCVHCM